MEKEMVKNYLKLKKSNALYSYFYYLDIWDRMGDRIFATHGLNVKITDDNGLGAEEEEYQLAEVRVRRKDEEELIKAFSEFSNKMLLTGHTDYDEYSEGIIQFFEEDMKLGK
ncbi:MAG: hypothetical protein IJ743_03275 [Bacilli bacterium]|nr:hypothetical protein [Bacilli bacterium]